MTYQKYHCHSNNDQVWKGLLILYEQVGSWHAYIYFQELWPQWYRQEFYGKYNELYEKDCWNQLRPLACSAIT